MSVTAADGFTAAGVACGIKPSGALDLAVVATSDGRPVSAAAVFTANKATAAPVVVTRSHLQATDGRAAAVVLNSGNANAATGASGVAAAERVCSLVAQRLGCRAEEVLVCSTGIIGVQLPLAAVEAGLDPLLAARNRLGGASAARAIMTTDTHPKEVTLSGAGFTLGGMAKGAAMLAPNMATMLAVLTTDAAIEPGLLGVMLRAAVGESFNALSVDGCTSTNDTVIALASGAAGPVAPGAVGDALVSACADLAGQMAGDAEGATKVVRVRVTGAITADQAAMAARKVADSQLVKCSLFGEDPYWGRVVSELGSAGVDFDPDGVTVSYGGVVVARHGVACGHDQEAVAVHLRGRDVELGADLGLGSGSAVIITTDLTHGYIDENARTS